MGDFQANFKRPDAGIRTVEGTVAGSRASQLEKKRKQEQEEFEKRKQLLIQERQRLSGGASGHHASHRLGFKFAGESNATHHEKALAAQTVGLVTSEQFHHLAASAGLPRDDDGSKAENSGPTAKDVKQAHKEKQKKLKVKKKMMSTLSFSNEMEDLDAVGEQESSSISKDPTVDTSFLPDKVREERAERERKRLEQEWKEQQEIAKKEQLEIVYSYWDGSGHRRTVICQKGDTVGRFLEMVRHDLCKEFRELASIAADDLLYVKEDLILPQDISFYDLIATKARGKSGPLFHFDVHDDVRIGAIDARIEKDESHPGKVVERRWYERNKHIFPASRYNVRSLPE